MVTENSNTNEFQIAKIRNNISEKNVNEKLKGAVFLTGITGIFLISGFSSAILTLKKNSPNIFDMSSKTNKNCNDTGVELALRALKWGTFYSSLGCGILFFSIWKFSRATSFEEFRQKVGNILPSISKKNSSL